MTVKAIFRLIRFPNLLMIAWTMYSFRHFLVIPILNFSGSNSLISHTDFFLIVLAVILIAAGGNVINDYYDVEIDEINKPEKIVIGRFITKEKAYLLFHLLSFSGIVISFYLGFFSSIPLIGFIHIGCAILLWVYARYLKRTFLAGNILISLLCGFTVFITAFYDQPAWAAMPIVILTGGYSAFAFMVSLVREMIKDLEDLKGDIACGCKTLPVIAGPRASKVVTGLLIVIIIILIGIIQYQQFQSDEMISPGYLTIAIQVPLILLLFRLIKSRSISDFTFCSNLCKVILMTGILSMFVFYLGFR